MPVPRALRCAITNHATFYTYRVMYGPCAKLDNPTLLDFLEDVRVDHDNSCGCGVEVQARAWKACIETEDMPATFDFDTSQLKECPLDTHLSEFSDLVENTCAVLHVLFEGKQGSFDTTYASSVLFSHDEGSVVRIAGASSHLATDADVTYDQMCQVSGMLIVDKSKFILPRYSLQEPRLLPVLRRPRGFGKTTFLSMLETWFDVSRGSFSGLFLSVSDPGMPELWSRYCRNTSSLVCHLDLSGLVVSMDETEESLRRTCQDFLNAAARDCFRRYQTKLKYPEFPFDCCDDDITLDSDSTMTKFEFMADTEIRRMTENITFEQLLRLISVQDYLDPNNLFVGVDNYTAPLKTTGKSPLLELVITTEIFEPIIRGLRKGSVFRAFMVGDSDLPGEPFMPYCVTPFFYKYTSDLSATYEMDDALGLTESEIVALGEALFDEGQPLLCRVREHAGFPVKFDEAGDPLLSSLRYSYRDVFALCHAMGSGAVPSSLTMRSISYAECGGLCPYRSVPDEIKFVDPPKAAGNEPLQNDDENEPREDMTFTTLEEPTRSPRSNAKRKERDDDEESVGRDGLRTPSTRSSSVERRLSDSHLPVGRAVPPSPSTTTSSSSVETNVDDLFEVQPRRKPRLSDPISEATSLDSVEDAQSILSADTMGGGPPPSPKPSASPLSTSPPALSSAPPSTSSPPSPTSSVKRPRLLQ